MNPVDRFILGVILLFLLLALAACATRQNVLELGAGYDTHVDEGSNPHSAFSFRNEPRGGNGWVYEFQHNSSIFDGHPFNSNPEDLTNQWSIKWRWVFR